MRILWLLLVVLVACQDRVQLAPSNILGLLEVELDAQSAKARFLPKPGLKAQNVLPDSAFVFTADTVTVLDGGVAGPRYIIAPFAVQNQTNTAVQNLTLYAYSQNGNSIGGTALKNIRDFNNVSITASQAAQQVKPVHAVTSGFVVNDSRADFQGFTTSQASTVQTQARSTGMIGASDTVLEYGFVARNGTRRGIGALGSGQVTLALRIPRDTGQPEPYRFTMTFVLVNESTTQVSRGYGEAANTVAARTVAILDRTTPTQVLLIGADSETVSCAGCSVSRISNALVSSQGTNLYRNANDVSFRTQTVADSLGVPWSINFAPDGTLLFTPRDSSVVRLRQLNLNTGTVTTFSSSRAVRDEGEGGVLGMELASDFSINSKVFICYSYYKDGVTTTANRRNRLSSFVISGGALTSETILFDNMLGWSNHNGCRVVLGNDDKLYFSMGDAADYNADADGAGDPTEDGTGSGASKAQVLNSLSGKIFRINQDGSIPADNPFFNTLTGQYRAIWSYGHRNPQGLAFRPGTSELWSTEHGPDRNDELNHIIAGKNYGWDTCTGVVATCSNYTNYKAATRAYEPNQNNTIAISDMVFYNRHVFPEWHGHLLFVSLKTGRLYRVELNGQNFSSEQILIDNTFGRLRDVTVGSDGYIYLSTDVGEIIRLTP
jgi:aldose sugar dehydrogenase